MKKNIRRSIDLGLSAVGVAVVISAIVLGSDLQVGEQMSIAVIGIVLMQAGIWGISSRLFPNQRRYVSLRDEGDKMLDLIRELNSAAIAKDRGTEDAKRFQQTLEAMHSSVVRMSEFASVETREKSAADEVSIS